MRNTAAHFQERAKHRNRTYPTIMLRLVPRTNTNAGVSANPIDRENQRNLLAGDFGKTIQPTPAAKTVSIAACPMVLGFQVVNAAALLNFWKLAVTFDGLAP